MSAGVTERLVEALRDVVCDEAKVHGRAAARRTAREMSRLATEAGFAVDADDLLPRRASRR